MTNEETARALLAIAGRVRRLRPNRHDPERFHVERDEIGHEIEEIAQPLAPRLIGLKRARELFSTGEKRVGARTVRAELRAPFARRAPAP